MRKRPPALAVLAVGALVDARVCPFPENALADACERMVASSALLTEVSKISIKKTSSPV